MAAMTFYEVLGIKADASQSTVTRAYRRLAAQTHPDLHAGDPAATERFKAISEAYETLRRTASRAAYDARRADFPSNASSGAEPADGLHVPAAIIVEGDVFAFDESDPLAVDGVVDLDEMFSASSGLDMGVPGSSPPALAHLLAVDDELQAGATTAHAPPPPASPASPGASDATVVLSLEQILLGGSVEVHHTVVRPCPACGGGAECGECGTSGLLSTARRTVLPVPRAMAEGTYVVGDDLTVTVRHGTDPRFTRDGATLTTSVSLSILDLLLGGTVEIETLDGRRAMAVAPNTMPGTRLTLQGHGLWANADRRADLVCQVDAAPLRRPLDETSRALLDALRVWEHGAPDNASAEPAATDGQRVEGSAALDFDIEISSSMAPARSRLLDDEFALDGEDNADDRFAFDPHPPAFLQRPVAASPLAP